MAKSDDELRQVIARLRERGVDAADDRAGFGEALDVIGGLSLLDFARLSEIARAERRDGQGQR